MIDAPMNAQYAEVYSIGASTHTPASANFDSNSWNLDPESFRAGHATNVESPNTIQNQVDPDADIVSGRVEVFDSMESLIEELNS